MIKIAGTLAYGPGLRAAVLLGREFGDYYYSLIPKYLNAQPQRYEAHLTVVRLGKETPPNLAPWGKYEGEQVEVEYVPSVWLETTYFFLDAWSARVVEIRKELGLPEYRDGRASYHITVGNLKEQ